MALQTCLTDVFNNLNILLPDWNILPTDGVDSVPCLGCVFGVLGGGVIRYIYVLFVFLDYESQVLNLTFNDLVARRRRCGRRAFTSNM